MEYNSKCSICGKPYRRCNDCSKSTHQWLSIVDSAEHYKIFMVLSDYNKGRISKNEARELLTRCDISGMEDFEENIKSAMKEILTEEKPEKPKETRPIRTPAKRKKDESNKDNNE